MKTKRNAIPTNKRVSICIDTLCDCKTHKDQEEYLTELSDDFSELVRSLGIVDFTTTCPFY